MIHVWLIIYKCAKCYQDKMVRELYKSWYTHFDHTCIMTLKTDNMVMTHHFVFNNICVKYHPYRSSKWKGFFYAYNVTLILNIWPWTKAMKHTYIYNSCVKYRQNKSYQWKGMNFFYMRALYPLLVQIRYRTSELVCININYRFKTPLY